MSRPDPRADILDERGYQRLRRASRTYREELVLRLGAEVGLRPAEMARLRPDDLETRQQGGRKHHLVSVPTDDGTDGRTAYLPPDVEHDLRQYARAEGVGAADPLFEVSERRIQMLVTEVGERVAERTGDGRLVDVSSRTLRQFFARRLLAEEEVHPSVVQSVGGWERVASLEPHLPAPDADDVLEALAGTGLTDGTAVETPEASGPAGRADDASGAAVDGLLAAVSAVGAELQGVSAPGSVADLACETLAGTDPVQAAWFVDGADADGTVTAAAGPTAPALSELPVAPAVGTAVAEATVQTTDDLAAPAFEPWADRPATAAFDGVAVVPVGHGGVDHGALCLATTATLGDRERPALEALGSVTGSALTAAQRRKLLLADTVVELELRCVDEASLFVALSGEHDCTVDLEGVVPGADRSLVYFLTLSGAPTETVLSWADDREAVADARLVRDHGTEALVEVVVVGADASKTLVGRGGTVREMTASSGTQRVVGDVSTDTDIRGVVNTLTDTFPATELVTKRERERPVETAGAVGSSLRDALTEKQTAVLQAAYHAGYFEWPRGSTAEELADAIGVTSPTLHNHLRRAQQKLLSEVFAGEDRPRPETPWTG